MVQLIIHKKSIYYLKKLFQKKQTQTTKRKQIGGLIHTQGMQQPNYSQKVLKLLKNNKRLNKVV